MWRGKLIADLFAFVVAFWWMSIPIDVPIHVSAGGLSQVNRCTRLHVAGEQVADIAVIAE